MLLAGAGMVALFFALSVYMQAVLGYEPLTTGLSQLPLAGALVMVAGVAPAVIGRLGTRSVLTGSLLVLAAGLVWLAFAPSDAVFLTQLLGPTLFIGVGLGGAFVTVTQLAVDGVDGDETGLAGGLINTSQQIGEAIGLGVLGTIAALRTSALEAEGLGVADALTGGYAWPFVGAAALAVVGAGVVVAWKRG